MDNAENEVKNHHSHHENCCSHARIQKFIEPCLLLLLAQQPTYGYDLIDKLDKFGFESPDPGTVYRYLRNLEELKYYIATLTEEIYYFWPILFA